MNNQSTPLEIRLGIFYDIWNIHQAISSTCKRLIPTSCIKFGALQKNVARNVTPMVSVAVAAIISGDDLLRKDYASHLRSLHIDLFAKPALVNTYGVKGDCDAALGAIIIGKAIELRLTRVAIVSSDSDFLDIPRVWERCKFLNHPIEFEFHYFEGCASHILKYPDQSHVHSYNLSSKVSEFVSGYGQQLEKRA